MRPQPRLLSLFLIPWRGLTPSRWPLTSVLGQRRTPTLSPVFIWRTSGIARPSTSSQYNNSLTPSLRRWILPLALHCEARSPPNGHQRLRHSMRAALWWLLPSDGDFRRASSGLHYYLAHQGRRVVLRGGDVTQPLYESRMNWVHDPAPPASRRPIVDFDASAITSASPGAPLTPPQPKKSRRRRRRRNRCSANQNSAPRSDAPVTPDERWANENSASQSATRPQSAANDLPQMMSTPVYQHPSFHSSHLPQTPFRAANENSAFQFGLDRCRIPGLYKLAHPDPRQDLTATLTRVNNSGSGFSSPFLLQPCTKPFSGLPSRQQMTCPTREAGEATRERPGVVYPLLPRAQRPDTRVVIEAALPEAAALDRRAQPPTVLEIGDTSLPQQA